MKIMAFTAFLFCLFVSELAVGQVNDSVWVVGGNRYLGEGFKRWRPELIFDGRRTFVGGNASRLGGLRVGMEHKRVHRMGVALYGLDNAIVSTNFILEGEDVEYATYQFSYLTLFYERVLWFHPKWEWSAAVHLGTGQIDTQYKLLHEDEFRTLTPITVKPFELSTSGYYNITWWLSAGGGMGYRYMRRTPPEVKSTYNGLIYIVKVKVKFGKLVKSIFNRDVKNEY
jgi:hypothetical protein